MRTANNAAHPGGGRSPQVEVASHPYKSAENIGYIHNQLVDGRSGISPPKFAPLPPGPTMISVASEVHPGCGRGADYFDRPTSHTRIRRRKIRDLLLPRPRPLPS
jgi:hypothetical protein